MDIQYRSDFTPQTESIIALYKSAGLNRPVDDEVRIGTMYQHANLVISAWEKDTLVGISRSLTDFSHCCYLADLAVAEEYQHLGIGKELVRRTKLRIGDQCMLLLLAAPAAMEYYPKIGFESVGNAFIIHRTL